MKIEYLWKSLIMVILLSTSSAGMAATPSGVIGKTEDARAARLIDRLEEIKAIDKSKLSHTEKKALRAEVKKIKKELAAVSGGVYLSVGALLLIVLLLILLL